MTSDTITILHMVLTFITSTTVAVLGFLKFQDRFTAGAKEQALEQRIANLEIELHKKKKKKH